MNSRTTVLFSITDLSVGGAQQQLLELVKGLDKERFRPLLLTLIPGEPLEREFQEVPGLEFVSLQRKGKYDLSYLVKVMAVLRRMKVDVVQPFLTPATFFTLLPALVCRTPVKVVTERAGPVRSNGHLGYRLYLKTEDLLTHLADLSVANSGAGRDYLVQRGIRPGKVRVIYNGLNFDRLVSHETEVRQVRQRMGLEPEGKVVGMMARMFPVKSHSVFLKGAALVSQAMPQTRFALVGDGPLRAELEKLAGELGLGGKAIFFGEQRNVGSYLSAFDIAVLTSETEGCSNSILEAMAVGKPVVCTDVGGNRELVKQGETGLLVSPGNAQALAEAVISLLKDPQSAREMGRRGKELVTSRFTLQAMVRQYQDLYESTLQQKRGGV